VDVREKVTGAAIYTDDIPFGAGLLHARVKRCPHAHALIKKIDISKARELAGVKVVVTGQDFPYFTGLYLKDRNIFARDGSKCQYCGRKFATQDLSLDHVLPRSQGGKSTWDNIVCCCIKCNVKKGGRTPEQAHMKLLSKPIKPKRSPVINIRLTDGRYASWKQFLDEAYWTVELR
jgi:5-methylcytosine-specific restriction endonuclease McrA